MAMTKPRSKTVRVVFPSAPPELYLAWIAFSVNAEQRIRERPHLRSRATADGYLTTPAARNAHHVVLRPLTEQAEAALEQGKSDLAPVIEAPREALAEAERYMEHWGEWLVLDDILGEIHLPLPSPEVAILRSRSLRVLRDHVLTDFPLP